MIQLDESYLTTTLEDLLKIPSPSGFTDKVVDYTENALAEIGLKAERTRKGALKVKIDGNPANPMKSVICHLDTLGAMVKNLKSNGRLELTKIGYWSPRFAEGARVTIFTDETKFRGTILPLKASGHSYNQEIDTQDVSWEQLEVRIDEKVDSKSGLQELGINVGDFLAVDPNPEFLENGFINSRYLDDKAGASCILAALKEIVSQKLSFNSPLEVIFTITEEEGTGACSVLNPLSHTLLAVDNATIAQCQNSSEYGVTIAMKDSSGPYDFHLTRQLIEICKQNQIEHSRDVFKHYMSDASAALKAGFDVRAALICFAVDASHGFERTHLDSLCCVTRLLIHYLSDKATD